MADKAKGRKGKKNSPRKKHPSAKARRPRPQEALSREREKTSTASESSDEIAWKRTRHGAWAIRGFSFQHTVSTWVAARILTGNLTVDAMVPESVEDISLEGEVEHHIQIKSRGDDHGSFSVIETASHVLKHWAEHRARPTNATLVIVFEREVTGESLGRGFDEFLADSLEEESRLRAAISEGATQRGWGEDVVHDLLQRTAVCVIAWPLLDELIDQTINAVAGEIPPSARKYLARELRSLINDAATENSSATHAQRQRFTRNDLARHVQRFVENVDTESLEAAIRDGICEPVSLSEKLDIGDRFYEGIATQPGHVAAGLVTPRKDLIGGILAGLEQDGAVVLTGPSGVGKSAVLWSVPHAAPGILWFQVHRLVLSDVEAIIRLVRAYRCSDARPIGLLIDSAGRGDRLGWTSLRERAAATPGLLIVATARHEDLVLLGDLNTCTTITVTLDETAASEIYDALKRRGATDLPHWREAFEQSGQLTLEYTYLLTNRRRLSDVVSDQIRRRIDDGRLKEVDVVSLVALADQWGASLSVDALAKACSLNPLELRKQLIRLLDEHLISESDGVVQGLHPVRSIAISNAIHNTPPPARHQTFTRVLSALDNSQISTFVVNALRDQPQLADAVTSAARQALLVELDFERVVAYMRGTRFFDFWTDVTQWMSIADHHGVPHGQRPLLFLFGIGDLTVPEDFPQEIVAARLAMASSQPASVADALVTSVNLASHIGELVESPDLRVVAALMFEAGALEDEDAARFIGLLDGETPLGRVLAAADASELSRVISTVRVVSPDVATKFLDVAGGEARVLELVRALNPWITELQVDNHPEGARIVARLLHVSDDVNGDPHDRVVELARVLLHCIPHADHVDIRVVLPGGHPYRLGEYDHGVTQLQSRYNQADVITSRNRERMKISRLLLGETDTVRLSSALPLLNEASTILEEVARCFVTQDVTGIDADALAHRCNDLGDRVGTLRPALGERKLPRLPATFTIEGDDEGSLLVNDHLAGLVTDITGNVIPRLPRQDQAAALASHINDHVIGKSLHGAKSERWHLLGMEPYPPVLDKIHDTLVALLSAIAEISRGPAARTMITRSARAGRRDSALIRARNTAITIRRRRLQRTRREIVDACRQVNVATQILTQNDASYELVPELAIVIDLDSIADWETSVSAAIEAIENLGLEAAKLTFVPMRNRQPVEQFAVTRIIETWPSGQLGIWRKQLAEPWDLALLGAFDTAVQSLQVQSGLLCAGSNRCGTPELTRVAESQNEKYLSAEPALRSDEPDVVVSHLKARIDELVQRLCEEANGQQQPGNLAGELWASALGYGTADIAGQIAVDRLLAVEWSIDRQQALRLASPLQ